MKFSDFCNILGDGKIRLSERRREHLVSFDLVLGGSQLALHKIVTVREFWTDELPPSVFRDCARELGITSNELHSTLNCTISRRGILLALAVLFHEARKRFRLDAEYGWLGESNPLDLTIVQILHEADGCYESVLSNEESALYMRLHQRSFRRCKTGLLIDKHIKKYLS